MKNAIKRKQNRWMILLAACLMAAALTACGGSAGGASGTSNASTGGSTSSVSSASAGGSETEELSETQLISRAFSARLKEELSKEKDMEISSIVGSYKTESSPVGEDYKVTGDLTIHEANGGPSWKTVVTGTCSIDGRECEIKTIQWEDLKEAE